MIRYLSISEVLELHKRIISETGGAPGLRDFRAVESSLSHIKQTFNQSDLYPELIDKAASLCFSLVINHPFVDGNKRIGHACMEIFLLLNGYEIMADIDGQERLILDLASGKLTRGQLSNWLKDHIDSRRP